jgi:hypothetical protein
VAHQRVSLALTEALAGARDQLRPVVALHVLPRPRSEAARRQHRHAAVRALVPIRAAASHNMPTADRTIPSKRTAQVPLGLELIAGPADRNPLLQVPLQAL